MPRYFFHVVDGKVWHDEQGVDLPDDSSAIQEGVRAAGAMIEDLATSFDPSTPWHMDVVEQSGRPVLQLRFSGAAVG